MQRINSINIYCNSIKYKKINKFFLTKLSSKNKKQEKESPTREHHDDIFNMYQQWASSDFSVNVDLKNFDVSNLLINVVNNIVPKYLRHGHNSSHLLNYFITALKLTLEI